MSLLATASAWTNNDEIVPKKRVSTLRKPTKIRPFNGSNDELTEYNDQHDDDSKNTSLQKSPPPSITDVQMNNENRQSKVTEMLNKITSITSDNNLADFNPMPNPKLNVRELGKPEDSPISPPKNPLQPPALYVEKQQGNYAANNLGNYSNYRTSYDPAKIINQPYYAKMGIGANSQVAAGDDKFMEKINYMIHLLEEQQNERTNNITEEFILYTFLGVFMIFIVDSFSRAGKYVR